MASNKPSVAVVFDTSGTTVHPVEFQLDVGAGERLWVCLAGYLNLYEALHHAAWDIAHGTQDTVRIVVRLPA
jgi:hypothetical protein